MPPEFSGYKCQNKGSRQGRIVQCGKLNGSARQGRKLSVAISIGGPEDSLQAIENATRLKEMINRDTDCYGSSRLALGTYNRMPQAYLGQAPRDQQ